MDKQSTPWQCGKPQNMLIEDHPEAENKTDPWTRILENISRRERLRYDAWKEEVQNLLVFAGLFSAVVSAFLVDSYKSLRADPAQQTVTILTNIAARLENNAASALGPIPDSTPFTPSSSTVRVNIFWFLSLICTLSSALVGIVLLQWLREHQRPLHSTSSIRPRISIAAIHMNNDAFNKYFVHEIFTSLPPLLILGLLFFFIGLVDVLWDLNHKVAGPSIAAIAVVFTFLLLSTILPGLQGLPGHHTKGRRPPRLPCPYKSPQAWAFLTFISAIKKIFKYSVGKKMGVLSSLFSDDLEPSWLANSLAWLRQRDREFEAPINLVLPLYDSVLGLAEVKENTAFDGTKTHDILPTVYNAFHILSEALHGRNTHRKPRTAAALLLHLQDMLVDIVPQDGNIQYALPKEFIFERDDSPKTQCDVLLDNVRLLFLHVTPEKDPRLQALSATKYHVEICVRLADYVFSGLPLELPQSNQNPLFPPTVLIVEYLRYSTVPRVVLRQDVTKQLLLILRQLFLHSKHRPNTSLKTTHTSPYMTQFLISVASIFGDGSGDFIRREHECLLESLTHRLDQHSEYSDYLFAIASVYASALSNGQHPYSSKGLISLSSRLQEYQNQLKGPSKDYVERIQQRLQEQECISDSKEALSQHVFSQEKLDGEEVLTKRSKGAIDTDHIEVLSM
ncbi:hypothetical protein CPB83DRAFT_783508 [Crepidotus variabilis]|uniref:DUF6535 domain-containing protein n=1 Tax=Crepidotus variabilis TaxID=179855 RepID=A0A9P6JTF8_9AGAR|nr:hypothetical protein CPB83DRAFT_783508 [Crepidotus variabilis]